MSIKCNKCGTINNDFAKFCAKCGQPIYSEVIIDRFKSFIPSSSYKNNIAVNFIIFFMTIIVIAAMFFAFVFSTWTWIECDGIKDVVGNDLPYEFAVFLYILGGIVLLWMWSYYIKLWKKGYIKNKCSLVEKAENRYLRIAINNGGKYRMGIFDGTRLKVILGCEYDEVKSLTDKTFLISSDNKYGLYNCAIRQIIVPVRYERISLYNTDIFTAVVGSSVHHFDIKGTKID